jgi:hypothetical protein
VNALPQKRFKTICRLLFVNLGLELLTAKTAVSKLLLQQRPAAKQGSDAVNELLRAHTHTHTVGSTGRNLRKRCGRGNTVRPPSGAKCCYRLRRLRACLGETTLGAQPFADNKLLACAKPVDIVSQGTRLALTALVAETLQSAVNPPVLARGWSKVNNLMSKP